MDFYGYTGWSLSVNLTSGEIKKTETLDSEEFARKWVGDFGFDFKAAYDLIKPGVEPLSPQNAIIVGAGPLVGTGVPSAGKCSLVTKSPLTNLVVHSSGSLMFGSQLKYAGYDNVVITGRSDKPVYLRIFDDDVEICDASDLWGTNVVQTTDRIWEKHGKTTSVISIGQAGENLVGISLCLVDKGSAIGHGGMAAVMASKNLKAIAIRGTKDVKIFDVKRFREIASRILENMRSWPRHLEYTQFGHFQADTLSLLRVEGITNYYKDIADWEDLIERIGPKAYARVRYRKVACPSCPIGCRDIMMIRQGEFAGEKHYAGGIAPRFGTRLGLEDMERYVMAKALCQRYGLDDQEFMIVWDFVRDLHRRGVITIEDTDGETFETGLNNVKRVIENTVFRRGIGDVLADGFPGIYKRFGQELREDAIEAHGVGITSDPRMAKLGSMMFEAVVCPMASVAKGGFINPGKFDTSATLESFMEFGKMENIPEESMRKIVDTPMRLNIGRLTRHTEDLFAIFSMLGICIRVHIAQFYSMKTMAELYSAVTGIELSSDELKKAGERVWNMVKVINLREGRSTRKDDRIPSKWFVPLKVTDKQLGMMGRLHPEKIKNGELRIMDQFETKVLTPHDLEVMLNDYYDESGWELDRGIPTKQKLIELGLGYVIKDLGKLGIILK